MSTRVVDPLRRPRGKAMRRNFSGEDGPVPDPGAGQFRGKIAHVLHHPTMGYWRNEAIQRCDDACGDDSAGRLATATLRASLSLSPTPAATLTTPCWHA